jgi:YD repeat-containing protein
MNAPAPGISFERDSKGRIVRRVLNLGQEPEIRRYAYAAGNRLSQAGRARYRHDAAGFRSFKFDGEAETRYVYEPSGLLLAVDVPSGKRTAYAYDSSGMRREKLVNGRLVEAFRWLDPLRLLEFFDGGEWWRLAYDGGQRAPVGVTNGSASYLIYSDHLGTPLALAGMDGNIVQAMRYDAFGNRLETRGNAVRLPIGFAGGLFDADTGRFTALDPLGEKGGDLDWYGDSRRCPGGPPVDRPPVSGLPCESAQGYPPPWTGRGRAWRTARTTSGGNGCRARPATSSTDPTWPRCPPCVPSPKQ